MRGRLKHKTKSRRASDFYPSQRSFFIRVYKEMGGNARVGNSLPSSHSVGMQQNRLVGLSEAPMKLATSG